MSNAKLPQKTIVSPFEFAITQIAGTPEEVAKIRPETDEEKAERRDKKLDDFFSRIKTKDGSKAALLFKSPLAHEQQR